jgi:hypothetical protein
MDAKYKILCDSVALSHFSISLGVWELRTQTSFATACRPLTYTRNVLCSICPSFERLQVQGTLSTSANELDFTTEINRNSVKFPMVTVASTSLLNRS